MKIVEVDSITSGIDQIVECLTIQEDQMRQIKADIEGIVALNDSFKGKGGQAIRSFYKECHLTFISFYQNVVETYKNSLQTIKNELFSLEPAKDGFIRESFFTK